MKIKGISLKKVNFINFLFYFLIMLLLAGSGVVGVFLYKNVYLSIDDAIRLSKIKGEVVNKTIDTELFEKVTGNLDAKTLGGLSETISLNNPFAKQDDESQEDNENSDVNNEQSE